RGDRVLYGSARRARPETGGAPMPLRLRPGDPASAGCLLGGSATPGGKVSVLHGREPGSRVRSCEDAELSLARGRARGTGRSYRRPPVGRAIVLRRGPVGKSSLFRRRGNCLRGLATYSRPFFRRATVRTP